MNLQLKPRSLSKPVIPRCASRVISSFVIAGCIVTSTLASELPADPTPCVVLQGNSIQGGMLWGQTSASAEIRFGDRRVPVLPDGQFLLGLGWDMPSTVESHYQLHLYLNLHLLILHQEIYPSHF